jgi:hypothetical protein
MVELDEMELQSLIDYTENEIEIQQDLIDDPVVKFEDKHAAATARDFAEAVKRHLIDVWESHFGTWPPPSNPKHLTE